jgi:CRP/FNR family transcriptional regulator
MEKNEDVPECLRQFQTIALPAQATVFSAGDPCSNFYFVQSGSIRVDLITAEGKSVLLYRIGPKQTCILSTSCLISHEHHCAEAMTETAVEAIAVPKTEFETLLSTSQSFRELVFQSFSLRFSTMMAKINEVSFASLDSRLAGRLLELGQDSEIIKITHEQLARDLGSAREVVSRKLLDWEAKGLIERGRGDVRILAPVQLKQFSTLGD